jgi:ketosteroid isomerase-like protein
MIDRKTAIASAEEFLKRFSAMDFDGLRPLLADDMVAAAPYSEVYPSITTADAFLEYMRGTVLGFVKQINFIVDAAFFDPEVQTAIVEFHNRGTRVDGRPYENDYVWIFSFRDGLISGLKIYYNPVPAA